MKHPKRPIHRISRIDEILRVGFCNVCNRVGRLNIHSRKNGVITWKCAEAAREYMRDWGKTRRKVIEKKELALSLKNVCEICQEKVSQMHWDHCHSTGRFRGMLCVRCNIMIGLADDSVNILQSAIEYLNRHK